MNAHRQLKDYDPALELSTYFFSLTRVLFWKAVPTWLLQVPSVIDKVPGETLIFDHVK